MDDKILKYKKSIEKFILVAESSAEIIDEIVIKGRFNNYWEQEHEKGLRSNMEIFFRKNRTYYPQNNMFDGKIILNPEMMEDLIASEFTYKGKTYRRDLLNLSVEENEEIDFRHRMFLKEKYQTDQLEYIKVETSIMKLFQDESFIKKLYTEISGESKKRNKDLDCIRISSLKTYTKQLEKIISHLDYISENMSIMCEYDIKRWKECIHDYSNDLLKLLDKAGSPNFAIIDRVFILKNLLDVINIDISIEDTDKFIAEIIGCPISTVSTYRNKFNKWQKEPNEVQVGKLESIHTFCTSLLNPENKNEKNQVVKKFLSSIRKIVEEAKEASKKKN